MSLPAFFFAVIALLLAPGPTNTLMGLAGAQHGVRGVWRLLPAELLGYLTTILPLAFIGADALGRWPAAAVAMKLAAACWVMGLAVRLWRRRDGAQGQGEVTLRKIYLTTMLNPKAMIFGIVLLPAPSDAGFLARLALFSLMVASAAMAWGLAGALAGKGGDGRRLRQVRRAASVWLAIVSVTLLAGIIGA